MSQLKYNTETTDIAAGTIYLTSSDVKVVATRGTSEKDVMSQNAVTNELNEIDSQIIDLTKNKLNKSDAKLTYLTKEDAEQTYQHTGDYALKSDMPNINVEEFAKKTDIPTSLSQFENDAQFLTSANLENLYYTVDEVNERIDNVKTNTEAWLHNYYTAEQIDRILQGDYDFEYLLTKEDAEKTYQHIGNYVTEEAVDEKIKQIDVTEQLESYATKAYVDEQVSSFENYDDTELQGKVTDIDSKLAGIDELLNEILGD